MPKVRERLVAIYAKHTLAELKELDELQQILLKNEQNAIVHNINLLLFEFTELLESDACCQVLSTADQVSMCLWVFNDVHKDEPITNEGKLGKREQLFVDLVLGKYGIAWEEHQQAYFRKICQYITKKHDYFISFTNRAGGQQDEPNPINLHYQYLLNSIYEEDWRKRKENKLAAFLDYRFRAVHQYKGFFFPRDEGDNADVAKKLKDNCDQSRNFFQIVQNVMFTKPESRENYCFLEFEQAKTTFEEDHLFFVMAERSKNHFISPKRVFPAYKSWHKLIQDTKDSLHLEFTRDQNDQKSINKILDELDDKLALRIEKNFENVLDGVPE